MQIIDKLRIIPALLTFGIAATLHAQTFTSGSTGADGDLTVNTAGVTIFNKVPQGGGNVYNFKNITIASGSTLRLRERCFPVRCIFWRRER